MIVNWQPYHVERWDPRAGNVRRWGFRARHKGRTTGHPGRTYVVEPNLGQSGWVAVAKVDDEPVDVEGPFPSAQEARDWVAETIRRGA